MKKLLMGGAIGTAVCYFFDRQRGKERRKHVIAFWRKSREAAVEAGHDAAHAVEPITSVPDRVLKQIDVGGSRATPTGLLPRLLLGALIAGAVVAALGYLLDPTRGADRRESLQQLLGATRKQAFSIGQTAAAAAFDSGRGAKS